MDNDIGNREGQLYLVGKRGYSAYEVAVQNGFVGTEEEWLASLKGEKGDQGTPFDELTPEQKAEIKGDRGYSSYEISVQHGFIGTEEEWVNSFLTPDGYYNKAETDSKLNKKPYYYNSVADMKADTSLKNGDMAITLGYYEANDGGGAEYKIRKKTTISGNQLFDKKNADIIPGYVNLDTKLLTLSDNKQESLVIKLLPNTTYTISGFERNSNVGLFTEKPIINNSIATRTQLINVNSSWTFSTSNTEIYLVASYNNSLNEYSYNKVMLNKGDEVLPYEPYSEEDDGGSLIVINDLVAEIVVKNDIINPKQFGAKGDGVTDDTESIKNLLTYSKLNSKKIIIPKGIFISDTINIDFSKCSLSGVNKDLSIIKAKNDMNGDAVIYCYNLGVLSLDLHDLTVDGNKNNVDSVINGVELFSDLGMSDTYSNIYKMNICNCTGNGLLLDSTYSQTGIREIRINNNNVYSNNLDGIYFKSTADSYVFQNTSHGNKQCGFHFKGGNIKILHNKAHNNGDGDGETLEELYRIPDEAFIETEDVSYDSSKTYYTRTGNGTSDVPYVFTLFEGNGFESGVVYYELTGIYYKKYPGYLIEAWSCLISNCEAQDSAGDGFYVSNRENVLENILADGNGRLRVNGSLVTYESQGLYQLYDGVYVRNTYNTLISGDFKNFRYNITVQGKFQRSAICLDNCRGVIANVISNNQIIDIVNKKTPKCNISVNGEYYFYEHDLSLLNLESGISLYSNLTSQNESYIKRQGNKLYIHLIANNSNNYATSDTSTKIITLPSSMKPKTTLSLFGLVGSNNGVNLYGYASVYINKNAEIAYRGNTSYGNSRPSMVIDKEYMLLD